MSCSIICEDRNIRSNGANAERGQSRILLPLAFQPGAWDVICHNGKQAQQHVGNRRFKICIQNFLHSFMAANLRSEKSAVISDVVSTIRESAARGGGFVRFDAASRCWYEVGNKIARDKVGQSLRDASNMTQEPGFMLETKKTEFGKSAPKRKLGSSFPRALRNPNLCSMERLGVDSIGIEEKVCSPKGTGQIQHLYVSRTESRLSVEIKGGQAESPMLCSWFEADMNSGREDTRNNHDQEIMSILPS